MRYFCFVFCWMNLICVAYSQQEFTPRIDLSEKEIIDAVHSAVPYTPYREGQCLEYARVEGEEVISLFRETVSSVRVKSGLYVVTVLHSYLPVDDLRKPLSKREFLKHQFHTIEIDANGMYHLTHNLQFDKALLNIKDRKGYAVLMPSLMQEGEKLISGTLVDVIKAGIGTIKPTAIYSNVVVVGNEEITTPAGTFKCVKISGNYKLDGKLGIKHKVSYKFNWWFAKGLGLVKSEIVDLESNSWLGPDTEVIYLNCINPNY